MGRPVGPPGAIRARLLEHAVALFSLHGISGTSLQMIAADLGVTKAAVYHQFASKDEIVLAVMTPALDMLADVAARTTAATTAREGFTVALEGLIDVVIEERFSSNVIRDPVAARLLESRPGYRESLGEIERHLIGSDPTTEARIALALLGGSLLVAGTDPILTGLGSEELRPILLTTARRLLAPFEPAD